MSYVADFGVPAGVENKTDDKITTHHPDNDEYESDEVQSIVVISGYGNSPRPTWKIIRPGLVGVVGFEPTTSQSRTVRATNCAIPRSGEGEKGW